MRSRSRSRSRSARSRSQSRRSRSRSREASIDASREIAIAILLISMIAIDADRRDRDRDRRRSAQFRWPARSRSWCVGVGGSGTVKAWRRSEGLIEQCVCERLVRVREGRKPIEVKITTATNFSRFWLIFRSNWKCFQFDRILQHNQTRDFPKIDFRKSISVEPNGA